MAHQCGGGGVDRAAGGVLGQGRAAVGGLTQGVEQAAEDVIAHRDADRGAGGAGGRAAGEAGGVFQRHRAHRGGIPMQLHLGQQLGAAGARDLDGLGDGGQGAGGKPDVDDRALHRHDMASEFWVREPWPHGYLLRRESTPLGGRAQPES